MEKELVKCYSSLSFVHVNCNFKWSEKASAFVYGKFLQSSLMGEIYARACPSGAVFGAIVFY